MNNEFDNREIIIYPAGRCAIMLNKILKKNNIKISYFCDKKSKENIDDIEVISLEELINKHKDAMIIIATVEHYVEIKSILSNNDLNNIYDISHLINKEIVDKEDWKIMKQYKDTMDLYSKREIIIPNLDLVITEKCSLKCKNCSNLMQYYKSPINYEVDDIMKPLYNILSQVKYIGELRIIGGEPFMNKQIYKIINLCLKEEKIQSLEILTNATILPNEEEIIVLTNPKVTVYISDYGSTSKNINGVINILKKYKINYIHNKDLVWREFQSFTERNYSVDQLKNIYLKCCCKQLFVLQRNKFFICPFLSNANNLVGLQEDNYVDCNDKNKLGEKIADFIINKKYFSGCAYCGGRTGEEKEVPAAEQLK